MSKNSKIARNFVIIQDYIIVMLVLNCILFVLSVYADDYLSNWDSLDKRPNPEWFEDAKFGIFIHWGVYSVPSYGMIGVDKETNQALGEWYQYNMQQPNTTVWKFHQEQYGEKFTYADFAPMFQAELWDPDMWADLFDKAGAKYIVLTSKHCDGFSLWPSEQKYNWNSVESGPKRDLVGDLLDAVRKRNIKGGLYYCNYEWFNPLLLSDDPHRYVDEVLLPMYTDLINKYKPEVLWGDYAKDYPSSWWNTTNLLSWVYNESPIRDVVAVDDRWGSETSGKDGGFWTVEYGSGNNTLSHKWEYNRGIGWSYGYNRMEDATIYLNTSAIMSLLVDTVSKNGNLLLDVGPTADGRIDNIQQERLLEVGQWLKLCTSKINGDAIYSTIPWKVQQESPSLWYTQNKAKTEVYALTLSWPSDGNLVLKSPSVTENTKVTFVGHPEVGQLKFTPLSPGPGLSITLPSLLVEYGSYAWSFKLENVN